MSTGMGITSRDWESAAGLLSVGTNRRGQFQVVDWRRFAAVGTSNNLHGVPALQRDAFKGVSRRGMPVHFVRWEMVVRSPGTNLVTIHEQLVVRNTVVLIEVLNVDTIFPRLTIKLHNGRARRLSHTGDAFAARGRLPRSDIHRRIAGQLHRFGFDTIR